MTFAPAAIGSHAASDGRLNPWMVAAKRARKDAIASVHRMLFSGCLVSKHQLSSSQPVPLQGVVLSPF